MPNRSWSTVLSQMLGVAALGGGKATDIVDRPGAHTLSPYKSITTD
jgi:hypothetical protein